MLSFVSVAVIRDDAKRPEHVLLGTAPYECLEVMIYIELEQAIDTIPLSLCSYPLANANTT